MEVYTGMSREKIKGIPAQARRAEAIGFDGLTFGEVAHDVFLMCTLALQSTTRIRVGTSIAVAFARSPMIAAYLAWDLQHLYDGRFEMGLGTQVKGHNIRRFGVPWTAPAARMREYALALRAMWDTLQNGTTPSFVGEHYRFDLMTPEFNPGPIEQPKIPIHIAAVGPLMCRVAGEVYDGVLCHPFTTRKYQENMTLPQLAQGAKKAGRDPKGLTVTGGGFIATGATEEDVHKLREWARFRVGWYGSTRSYHPVLEQHGWQDVGMKLHELSLKRNWDALPKLVSDEMLDAFCVAGTYDEIVPKLKQRYKGVATRIVQLNLPENPRFDDRVGSVVEELKRI